MLSWISLLGSPAPEPPRAPAGVSILVVLDQSARPDLEAQRRDLYDVSILVVLDQSARPRNGVPWGQTHGRFNPCCLGSVCSAGSGRNIDSTIGLVSILVVLDQSARREHTRTLVIRPRVSILVVLDQSARHRAKKLGQRIKDGFQSLLSWISLLGFGGPPAPEPCLDVSILVVLDQSARPALGIEIWRYPSGFQSLLSWISLLGRWSACMPPASFEFQSLLSWISLLGHRRDGRRCHRGGVSILVVLDQSARQAGLVDVTVAGEGFNPCCLGSVCSAARRRTPRRRRPSFNPCCLGSVCSATNRPAEPPRHRRFNPCCLGSVCSATVPIGCWSSPVMVSILVVLDQSARHLRDR